MSPSSALGRWSVGFPNRGQDGDNEAVRGEFSLRAIGLDGDGSIRAPGLVGVVADDGFADGQLGELDRRG